LTRWPTRDQRARVASATAAWFNPQRWSPNDLIIAIAALVLVVSLFVPWFKATVRIRGASLSGFLISPRGTASGIAVHGYLWAVFALALLQLVVLAARYAPDRRAFTLPGYRQLLVVTSGLSCVAVVVAFVMKPGTWHGGNQLGGGLYIVVGVTYGAIVALGAAIVSLGFAVAAIRDQSVTRPG
jgi:hypothetical protein